MENIQILDVSGKLVKQFLINDTKTNIQLSGLEKGVYFVKVDTEIKKLIIE